MYDVWGSYNKIDFSRIDVHITRREILWHFVVDILEFGCARVTGNHSKHTDFQWINSVKPQNFSPPAGKQQFDQILWIIREWPSTRCLINLVPKNGSRMWYLWCVEATRWRRHRRTRSLLHCFFHEFFVRSATRKKIQSAAVVYECTEAQWWLRGAPWEPHPCPFLP